MAINTALLQTTNDLQQYLVDKETGLPLSAGVITLYKDNSRTFLKNWYYQSGSAPNYTYIPLPNPLTLSSSGTVVDVGGNDVLPFYYPFSEADGSSETYYITVDNSNGQRQFTRQNFPFNGANENPSLNIPTLQNLIVNNNFWRNIGSISLTSVTSTVSIGGLCPSAHDGFSMPDLQFFKSVGGADDTVSFNKIPAGTTFQTSVQDITPEYYLNHTCTTVGAETYKYYQIPIVLHIKNLESQTATFTIDAQSLGSIAGSVLKFGIYQFPGSSALTPPIPTPIKNGTFTLNSQWTKYTAVFQFPSAQNVQVSYAGDDALYLVIFIPPAVACNINFTQPSIFLGTQAPTNNFQTYDESDAIINSPRTGDYRVSLNSFQPFGWVPANDGSIGALTPVNSSATTRANNDTWPLYNLIYTSVSDAFAPVPTRTGNAYNDFIAGKPLTLTKTLGRVLAGLNSNMPPSSNGNGYIRTGNTLVFGTPFTKLPIPGTPVLVTGTTLSAPLTANTVYFICNTPTPTTTIFSLSLTLDDALAGNAITLTTAGSVDQKLINALGATEGLSFTTQVPNHTHPFTSDEPFVITSPPAVNTLSLQSNPDSRFGTEFVLGNTANNTGGVTSIGLLQPTTFTNVFIKL